MKIARFRVDKGLWAFCGVLAYCAYPQRAPDEAFKTISATFCGEAGPLNVNFKQGSDMVGAVLESPTGGEIARAEIETQIGFLPGTGVYDVTGDGCPDVVLYAQVGGKATELCIYAFDNGKLQKLLDWSGWSYKFLHLDTVPVVALKDYETHGLTNLFTWKDGKFQRVNEQFPGFYAPEIADAQSFLEGSKYFGAGTTEQACAMAAQGLVYGKHYDEAAEACRRADEIIAAHLDDPFDGEYRNMRLEAAQEVRLTVDAIERARQASSRDLVE